MLCQGKWEQKPGMGHQHISLILSVIYEILRCYCRCVFMHQKGETHWRHKSLYFVSFHPNCIFSTDCANRTVPYMTPDDLFCGLWGWLTHMIPGSLSFTGQDGHYRERMMERAQWYNMITLLYLSVMLSTPAVQDPFMCHVSKCAD